MIVHHIFCINTVKVFWFGFPFPSTVSVGVVATSLSNIHQTFSMLVCHQTNHKLLPEHEKETQNLTDLTSDTHLLEKWCGDGTLYCYNPVIYTPLCIYMRGEGGLLFLPYF